MNSAETTKCPSITENFCSRSRHVKKTTTPVRSAGPTGQARICSIFRGLFFKHNGFTLIELIVVISLISLMFFFAIPRIQVDVLSDNSQKASRWIMLNVSALKEKAVHDQKRYALHLSIDSNRLWITSDTLSAEELEGATEIGYELPEDIKLLDVEYPNKEKISVGRADIYFYKKGYSDKAIIHITNDDNEVLSFLIEPFLSRARLYNKYLEFVN
jgi:prepilin-type N-terminal cleavage/methylation domain-containing protein